MNEIETEIFKYAVKLLGQRDYSVAKLREKIESKFGEVSEATIQQLIAKHFLNDRRFAESHVSRHKKRGKLQIKQDLLARGIPDGIAAEVLSGTEWLTLTDALKAKMDAWHLRVPLQPTEAARLFRAMARLGYEEDAIREEIEQLCNCG